MKTITVGPHTFEIVEEVPHGYEIWNIGKNMIDGYLPLCRLSQYQPFPGGRQIEGDTLKAIQIEGAQTILAVVTWDGATTLEKMEKAINKHKNAKPGTFLYNHLQELKKALPIMKQIKWR